MLTFTLANLKARIKRLVPAYRDMDSTVFDELVDTGLRMWLSDYQKVLMDRNDRFIRYSTLSEAVAPATGTEKINTTIGDLFRITLLAAADRIADDTILLFDAGTAEFITVPRKTFAEIVTSGVDATIAAFLENNGEILLYVKQDEIAAPPADLHYNYFKQLTPPAADGDDLPILPEDFAAAVEGSILYMAEG